MTLFNDSLEKIGEIMDKAAACNLLQNNPYNKFAVWPEKQSLVLQDDTAIELGSGSGSLFMVLWSGDKLTQASDPKLNKTSDHKLTQASAPKLTRTGVSLIGNDLDGLKERRTSFAQIIIIEGIFDDQYETYRDLRDIIFDTKPEGVSVRIQPDRQKIWCRISKDALDKGFNLKRYGNTLIKRLQKNDAVKNASVIFVTDTPDMMKEFVDISDKVNSTVDALIKMYEEMNFDCEDCEYIEVCEEVAGLREIRERLRKEREKQ